MARSRFSRNLEQQSKKQLIISIVSILIILFLILKYGIYAIEGIGNLTLGFKSEKQDSTIEKVIEVIPPPTINEIPKAINTNTLDISGKAFIEKGVIELFLNDKSYHEKKISAGGFSFSKIALSEGENVIKVKQIIGDKESEFSKEYKIVYEKEPPKIENITPVNDANFNKGDQEIEVSGKTDPNNQVTVNGYRATIDGEGNFSYYLRLNDGDNALTIEATSLTGLKTKEEKKVKYNP